MKHKITFAIVVMLVVLITVSSALAAINVITQPGKATEGKLYTYDINVDVNNVEFTELKANGFSPQDKKIEINKTTGVFTWIPAAGETGDKKFDVKIINKDNNDFIIHTFMVKVEPVLEISSMKIGKTGGNLKSYSNDDTTDPFYPGDNMTVELAIKNKYTSQSHELISNVDPSLTGIIENVVLSSVVDGKLTNFPNIQNYAPNPFYLDENKEQLVSFTYEIPKGITFGTYSMTFKVNGDDLVLPNPGNQYQSQKKVLLKVNQKSYDVSIKSAKLQKDVLTCNDKKSMVNLDVELANTGVDDEKVKVEVTNNNAGIKEEKVQTIIKESSNPSAQIVTIPLSLKNIVGEEQLTVKVYKYSTLLLYSTINVKVTASNCPPEINPISTVSFEEDTTKTVDLSNYVSNLESNQVLSYKAQGNNKVSVSFSGNIMTLSPAKNWYGTESFFLTVSDGKDETKLDQAVTVTVTQNKADDLPSISSTSPEKTKTIKEDEDLKMNVIIDNPDGLPLAYKWYVDNVAQNNNNGEFTFNSKALNFKVGVHTIKVVVNEGQKSELTYTWTVTTADRPVDINLFPGIETTDLAKVDDITSVPSFTLDNTWGKVVFNGNTDLSEIISLAQVVSIGNGLVAVDSAHAPELNKAATITIKKTFSKPIIQKSVDYKSGIFTQCSALECKQISNANGKFVFTVTGFSTYQVIEEQVADIKISDILFDGAERGKTANTSFTIRNTGSSQPLTNLGIEFVGVNNDYNIKLLESLPSTLTAGQEITVKIQIDIPKDEDGGKHSLGTLKVSSNEATREALIYINAKSFLTIESIDINGDSSGDLSIEEKNDIEVKVKNNYQNDIEDITITVKILDVDGDDLEEESEEFDLDTGDEEEKTLEFDLSRENMDEEEYTLEVTVEGEAKDGSTHRSIETKTTRVDREKHKVVINSAALSSSILQCSTQTSLYVTIENVGESDERDVEIKVKNNALNLDLSKQSINLDKFSGSDNDYKATFSINVGDAPAGTYPLTIEIYRDDDMETSEQVNLEIKNCLSAKISEQKGEQLADEGLAAKLQAKIAEYTQSKQAGEGKTIAQISFRDSDAYVVILGVLVVLTFIALVLGLVVLMVKKK